MQLQLTPPQLEHLRYLLEIRIQSCYLKHETAVELNEIYRRITGYDHRRIAAQQPCAILPKSQPKQLSS